MIFVLVLVAFLAIETPEACHRQVVPLAVTRQTAPIDGIPVLFDGAAVSINCKF